MPELCPAVAAAAGAAARCDPDPDHAGRPARRAGGTRYAHIVRRWRAKGSSRRGLLRRVVSTRRRRDPDGAFPQHPRLPQRRTGFALLRRRLAGGWGLGLLSISVFEPGFVKIHHGPPRGTAAAGGIIKFYFGADDQPFVPPCRTRARRAYLEMIAGSGLPQ